MKRPLLSDADVRRPRRWTRAEIEADGDWRLSAPDGLATELEALDRWSQTVEDPVDQFELSQLKLPVLAALAMAVQEQLDTQHGVAWVRQLPPSSEMARRLAFVAIGLCMGRPVGAYGRLYEVLDTGRSYRDEPIPVSKTRESTGVHTDSSNRAVCPRYIGLLCIRPRRLPPADPGGMRHHRTVARSALARAPRRGDCADSVRRQSHALNRVYVGRTPSPLQPPPRRVQAVRPLARRARAARVRRGHPEALEILYGDFVRDLVTPGAQRDHEHVLANAFPVFSAPPGPAIRYMRYWIERGQTLVGQPLDVGTLAAFDHLDRALEHPDHVLRFRLEAGDMMFCDNRIVVHDRDAYESDPEAPRLLCRLWIDPEAQP